MRLVKVLSTVLFAAIALLAGLFTALLVAIGGALIYFSRRLFGTSRPVPASDERESLHRYTESRNGGEVIDVTATEVPADPATR